MAGKIQLEIATPEQLVLSASVDHVSLPSVDGYMGVLAGHAPLLARLEVGEIAYDRDGRTVYLSVSAGFAEVLDDHVQVLAETCEPADRIDLARAERARDDAEKRMRGDVSSDEFAGQEVRLKRAINRIRVAGKAKL